MNRFLIGNFRKVASQMMIDEHSIRPKAMCSRTSDDGRGGTGTGSVVRDKSKEKEKEREENVLCRRCRHVITSPNESISISGSHLHTFANPHGMVFDIMCFRTANGCGCVGGYTSEFTWFAGYEWRIAICGACMMHLGWYYVSHDDSFYGLIVDRIIGGSR